MCVCLAHEQFAFYKRICEHKNTAGKLTAVVYSVLLRSPSPSSQSEAEEPQRIEHSPNKGQCAKTQAPLPEQDIRRDPEPEDPSQAEGQTAGKESDPVPERDIETVPLPDPEALGAGRIGECRARGAFDAAPIRISCHPSATSMSLSSSDTLVYVCLQVVAIRIS